MANALRPNLGGDGTGQPPGSFDRESRPELLAPAGDAECARAAVENGADAVYFGLRSGLNARARAVNFAVEELPELLAYLHPRGVRGYLTLNTLVFGDELPLLEETARAAVTAGVDAVLVQDLGAARLIHTLAPEWPIHASTQMALTSAENIRAAEPLGIRRVVLPRELSLDEIRAVRAATAVELEVFVHGALCMSYSGQCLASLAMGGRSGNRGQCAQACRLPYDLLCDAREVDLQGRSYLLSPLDLAAYDLLPELIAAGVSAVKIEGRLKSAEYVAGATRQYRRAIDEAMAGRRIRLDADALAELEGPFSRGFSHGWLDGHDDGRLVPGRSSAKRGVRVGRVRRVRGSRIAAELTGPLQRGDGVVFASEDDEGPPQGGRVYEIFRDGQSLRGPVDGGTVELTFGRDAIDPAQVQPGQEILKTDDPRLGRRLRKTFAEGRSHRRVGVDLAVEAAVGRPLVISARADSGAACRVESEEILAEARQHAITADVLRAQLGRLGGTVYELRRLDAEIIGRPMVPLSVLGRLRHEMVRRLEEASAAPRAAAVLTDLPPQVPGLANAQAASGAAVGAQENIAWHVLCRSLAQLDTALARHPAGVIADFAEIDQYAAAVSRARARGIAIRLATPRIQKPHEAEVFAQLAAFAPDGLLVHNLAGAAFAAQRRIPFVADASLHAANPWTVGYLHELGAQRVTPAADLDRPRLLELAASVPAAWLEVVVYGHLPMFHTEHCLVRISHGRVGQGREGAGGASQTGQPLIRALSVATVKAATEVPPRNRFARPTLQTGEGGCGQVCRRHDVRLRDRRGVVHPLRVDACCRNTLYHAEPRSLLDLEGELCRLGVRHFRIELLDGMPQEILDRLKFGGTP